MSSLFKILFLGFFLGAILWLSLPLFKRPTQIIPYPYIFEEATYQEQNPKASILILGDRMGKRLYEFAKPLSQELSKDLLEPVQIESWAQSGDGFHRTLEKLKNLKKIPKIILFHGLSQEFVETRFESSQINTINYNFNLYSDPNLKTAIYFFPLLSRYIYSPVNRQVFSKKITPFFPDKKTKKQMIEIQALTYKTIGYELDDFISRVKKEGSILILITTPTNYSIPPQKACSMTVTSEIKEKIDSAEDYIRQNLFKEALYILSQEELRNIPNPYLYFLRGQLHQNLMEYSKSIKMYKLAASFDCKLWRGSPVLNSILRQKAKEHQVYLFDFARMLDQDFFINTTFHDELYPQDLYYERLVRALGREIKGMGASN